MMCQCCMMCVCRDVLCGENVLIDEVCYNYNDLFSYAFVCILILCILSRFPYFC